MPNFVQYAMFAGFCNNNFIKGRLLRHASHRIGKMLHGLCIIELEINHPVTRTLKLLCEMPHGGEYEHQLFLMVFDITGFLLDFTD